MTQAIYRKNYTRPNFLVKTVELSFELAPERTIVSTQLHLIKNPQAEINERNPNLTHFILNGHSSLELLEFKINAQAIDLAKLKIIDHNIHLDLAEYGSDLIISYRNAIAPNKNTALEGLYISNDIYCSDCEPEGFRKITFYPDRPDIMAIYTVKIIAPKTHPVLLSNGNLIESGEIDAHTHYAVWHDPYPKSSYIFALVAGDLTHIEGQHIRPNGKPVALKIYALKNNISQCDFALEALKKSMIWDEQTYGLVMDLDIYNIVAIDDFNAGAMENKGLNIFNTKFVLADEKTATDDDFFGVESVIAHEYFHNWTGNRVTCRDWFQLSLKEGLTVFRDQEFSADLHHRGLQRIADVAQLRAAQFPEDASVLAHPVRPDSYIEMRNFYSTTVYEKGAEVVRLYQTLLGKEGFRKGMDLYFQRHDGSAVTCDDFLAAMRDANQAKLPNFERWYSQAGTPLVKVSASYDAQTSSYTLNFSQILNDSGNQKDKLPQLIPIQVALLTQSGQTILEDMVILNEFSEQKTYQNISAEPIPSLLRNFSAPVKVEFDYSNDALMTLIKYDTDGFNRYDAMQRLSLNIITQLANNQTRSNSPFNLDQTIYQLFEHLLNDALNDPQYYAQILTLASTSVICSQMLISQPREIYHARKQLISQLAQTFEKSWLHIYQNSQAKNPQARALKNTALSYLAHLPHHNELLAKHYDASPNMTDRLAALQNALWLNHACSGKLLEDFYHHYQNYPLVIDKWFTLQAANPNVDLQTLNKLAEHSAFVWTTPNRVRALLGAFGQNLPALMQNPDIHYAWLLEKIIKLDSINPQGSARLITPLIRFQQFDQKIQNLLISLLKTAVNQQVLSKNLSEQIGKALKNQM